MTDQRISRIARAVLAATTSVFPLALWAAPAAADPPTVTLTGDACGVTATGTGVDELVLYWHYGFVTMNAVETTGSTLNATYGDWLLPDGETGELIAEGWANGAMVASDSMTVGTCQTAGSSITLSAVEIGPAPANTQYGVQVRRCAEWSAATYVDITAAAPKTVPVPTGMEICADPGTYPAGISALTVAPAQLTGPGNVVATADWMPATQALIYDLFDVNGSLVQAQAAGVDPSGVHVDWVARDAADQEFAAGSCPLDAFFGYLECSGPRFRPGGTIEVTEYGASNWTLAKTVFTEADCTYVSDGGSTWCEVTMVNEPVPGSQPGGGASASETVCDPSATNPFTDLAADSVHTPNVVCAADLGLVHGGPEGLPASEFGPTLTTSRAQLASLVRNLLEHSGVPLPSAPADAFSDDDGSVHESSIDALAALGIIGGNGEDGTSFFPSRAATRSEIASFLAGAYEHITGQPLPAGPDVFGDDTGDAAESDINALAAAGVLSGKAPGVFDPTATVTREQIATLFVRLLDAATA